MSSDMDNLEPSPLPSTASKPIRKRRTNLNRRPLDESPSPQVYQDSLSLSSTPQSYNSPSDDNVYNEGGLRRKELSLSQCISRASYTNLTDSEALSKSTFGDGKFGEDNFGEATEKVEEKKSGKVRKVKLKVGGVTHTIHAKTSSDGSSLAGSAKSAQSDAVYPRRKLNLEESLDKKHSLHWDEKVGLRGIPWKDFSKSGFSLESSRRKIDKYGQAHKGRHVPKKRLCDVAYDDNEEDDDEILYLQKLKSSKIAAYNNTEYGDETGRKKLRKISTVMERNLEEYDNFPHSSRESNKSRSARTSQDTDYIEDEESVSDGEQELDKKDRNESIDFSGSEMAITTRRKALQTGRNISTEFPNGLPPAPPRKQKEQLSEVEQQLKRTEAAQRRKMQNEKAAQESEAEAIRKILGQDSSRKKREEKIKRRQEQLAWEKNANAATIGSNFVRWVMGPSGTTVIFPDDIGLPDIFDHKPCSYPPPREKCAGPSCTNTYIYRDAKSNLPLCSLQCYKAVHEKMRPLATC